MDDTTIRALVGWRVQHGRLPRTEPLQVWARHGHGGYCAGCGEAITPDDVEYEMEWSEPLRTVRMHSRCYEIWHAERPPTTHQQPPVTTPQQQVGSRPTWW